MTAATAQSRLTARSRGLVKKPIFKRLYQDTLKKVTQSLGGSVTSSGSAIDPNRPFAMGRNGQTLRVTDAAFDPAQSFITFDYS